MKIESIEPIYIFADSRNWVIVKTTTDTGIVGLGEATVEGRSETVATAIGEMSRYLLGKDPLQVERHYQHLYRSQFYKGGPILMSAISGIEQSLWDIMGKHLDLPLYALWGGPLRDRVQLYATGWMETATSPDEVARNANAVVQKGYTALKIPGFALDTDLSGMSSYRWGVDCVRAVRETVGNDIRIMVDMHGRTTPAEAIELAREYRKLNIYFFEEPTYPENIAALAEIRQQSGLRIATGERLFTCYSFREVLERRAADILQPDLCHCGGLSEARRIAAMAEAHYARIAPHNPNSPISTAACVQLAASIHNFDMLEYLVEDVPWRDAIFPDAFKIEDGHISLPNKPGLGIEWDESVARQHPYKAVDLPVCRLADGSVAEW